jgi:hypothetical protein
MAKKKVPNTKTEARGKCDSCAYCRFVSEVEGKYLGGLCEIGLKVRGFNTLPAEQTCSSWSEKREI